MPLLMGTFLEARLEIAVDDVVDGFTQERFVAGFPGGAKAPVERLTSRAARRPGCVARVTDAAVFSHETDTLSTSGCVLSLRTLRMIRTMRCPLAHRTRLRTSRISISVRFPSQMSPSALFAVAVGPRRPG